MLKNFRPKRRTWSRHYYLDPAYRDALTKQLAARVEPEDFAGCFLQIGAMFSMPQAVKGKALCVAYHDSNIAEAVAADDMRDISRTRIDDALAYERELAQSCDMIFVIGNFLRTSFIDVFGISPSRVITVGGGPNLGGIPDIDSTKVYDTSELLYVGVDFERKGGAQLLRAFCNVAQRFPAARLHIVGPRHIRIPGEIREKVIFHGYVSRQTPGGAALFRDLYHRCSVFVLPSLYEPFGMSSLEAMLCQIPVVVTKGWGWLDSVKDGVSGFLVERGNIQDLTETLAKCLSDPDRLQRMGRAGRENILGNFTWELVARRMHEALGPLSASATATRVEGTKA